MNKILVLNPPAPDHSYINRDLMGGMGVHIKLGGDLVSRFLSRIKSNYIRIPVVQLVSGATLLEKEGFDLCIIDAANENKNLEYIIKEIKRFQPTFVIMAISSSGIIFERDVVAAAIKKTSPSIKIIVVGDMITEMPELIVPFFDIAIMGEIETNIIDLCKGENPELIPGLILHKEGKAFKTGTIPRIEKEKLEQLPFPSWHLFPYKKYRYYPMVTKTPVATIQASRGCPYGCGYCPYTKNQGKAWRARSAQNIFEEIIHDINYGFKAFFFRDPLFTLNRIRTEQLCDLIIQKKIKVQFVFETRPELLTHNLIDKLQQAGCTAINFGIEDINPDILKAIFRKPVDTDLILDIIHYCEKKGIRTSCFFIFGLPGSTKKTIEESILFSKKIFASQIEYKIATPYPGTELYHMAKEKNWLISESFDTLTGYTSSMQVSQEITPEYLEKKSSEAFRNYYFSPKYLFRELMTGRFFKSIYFAIKYFN